MRLVTRITNTTDTRPKPSSNGVKKPELPSHARLSTTNKLTVCFMALRPFPADHGRIVFFYWLFGTMSAAPFRQALPLEAPAEYTQACQHFFTCCYPAAGISRSLRAGERPKAQSHTVPPSIACPQAPAGGSLKAADGSRRWKPQMEAADVSRRVSKPHRS